ncbi:hypothetical protein JYP46_01440 [Nitratireductor aquimarinus]|uniref:hypothetical protein n=1 Tax=Alphaproteobacteria TaxID=28211 RepID=UPI0019D33CE2|nr:MULTISPECIES: hypothetical protein [Alphaproteobacteria]MBN7755474.1 hypothetical protein [Nitratireductor aquimarinus]MBY5998229.1 hypothetical protein [Tritonibacter mobilis]MBY6020257.1 hypothetical protein [Nitratireductor sp. DP7N14-4]
MSAGAMKLRSSGRGAVTPVERMAEAILAEHERNGRCYGYMARAGLEAIREPSQAMIEAGSLAFSEAAFECGKPSKEALRHAWQVMIDAALSET